MIIPFPTPMTADNWQDLRLEGRRSLVSREGGIFTFQWTLNGLVAPVVVDLAARTIDIPDDADPQLVAILQAKLDAFGLPPAWHAGWPQLRDAAQSAVGKRVDQLTAAERNAILFLILWDKKGIDGKDMTIKPLNKWVVRRPDE